MSFTPAQCRAARGLLGWSQDDLAKASKVATKTIADFERESRSPYKRTLADIQHAFEEEGVEFTNGGQPGVRIKIEFLAEKKRLQEEQEKEQIEQTKRRIEELSAEFMAESNPRRRQIIALAKSNLEMGLVTPKKK